MKTLRKIWKSIWKLRKARRTAARQVLFGETYNVMWQTQICPHDGIHEINWKPLVVERVIREGVTGNKDFPNFFGKFPAENISH